MKHQQTQLKEDEPSEDDEATPLQPTSRKRLLRSKKKASQDAKTTATKWILLMLCCIVMSCMYYILAMPAALHRQLEALMPSTDDGVSFEVYFNLLFTVSYFPNMIIPMFGGAIVDTYGEAACLVTFCTVVLVGQSLTAAGTAAVDWSTMLAGRLLFGLGAQNLIVANASLVSKWFAGGNEGTALGLCNVVSYGGVIATNMLSPKLANWKQTVAAFRVGTMAGTVAVVLSVIVWFLDHNHQRTSATLQTPLVCTPMFSPVAFTHQHISTTTTTLTTKQQQKQQQASTFVPSSPGAVVFAQIPPTTTIDKNHGLSRTDAPPSVWDKLRHFKPTFWLLCASFLLVYGVVWSFTNVASGILLERDFFKTPPATCTLQYPDKCSVGTLAPSQGNPTVAIPGAECSLQDNVAPLTPTSLNITVSNLQDAFNKLDNMSENSALLEILHVTHADIQCSEAFWAEGCTQDYCQDAKEATEKAGFFMSIPYFFTVALTSLLGVFVDKTGLRTEMITFGSALLVFAHVLLAFPTSSSPVVPLVGQGLGYTICVAALWPSVPFTVSPDSVGLAFGIMMAVQNVGLALIPLIVAWLYGIGQDRYLPWVEIFFTACSMAAVGVGVALKIADKKTDHVLGTPKSDIRVRQDKDGHVVLVPANKPRHVRSRSEVGQYGT